MDVIGGRITERLKLLDNMSQSELARRVGLTQGTIAQLISGRSRSSSHLHKIARELRTTPAYLTGETDDPTSDVPEATEVDSETRELIELILALEPADRRAILQVARSLSAPVPVRTAKTPKLTSAR